MKPQSVLDLQVAFEMDPDDALRAPLCVVTLAVYSLPLNKPSNVTEVLTVLRICSVGCEVLLKSTV